MKRFIASTLLVLTAIGLFLSIAAQGSGQSGDNRNDDNVVICHYDRNDSGPNAGPHTITVDAHSVAHHLANHTKTNGYVGDDSLGACPVPTATNTPTATATVVPPTATATATDTPVDPTETATATATDTPVPPTATDTPFVPVRSSTPTNTPVPPTATATAAPTGAISTAASVTPTAPQVAVRAFPSTGDGSSQSSNDLNWPTAFVIAVSLIAGVVIFRTIIRS